MKNSREIDKENFEDDMLLQFKRPRHSLDVEQIKSHVLNAIREKNYDLLYIWLNSKLSTQEARDTFFSENGHKLLRYIISNFDDLNVLEFIEKSFSDSSIKTTLRNDNCHVIEGFFLSMGGAEMFQHDNDFHRETRIEKLKFILRHDEEILKMFIVKHNNARFMTQKIKEDCLKAEKEVNSGSKNTLKC